MRILVTGASGLIGSNLVVAAQERGWSVTGTWRSAPIRFDAAKTARLDMAQHQECRDLLRRLEPEVVVHAAASVDLTQLERDPLIAAVNAAGTENMLAAAEETGARFVLVSSDWVFGGDRPVGSCWSEDDPTCPANAYGRSKLASEMAVREARVPWLITRPANVYGVNLSEPIGPASLEEHVWERSSLALRWVHRLQVGGAIPAPHAVNQSPTSAWDYAKRVCELVRRNHTGVWNLAGPLAMDRHAYLRSLAASFDCDLDGVIPGSGADLLRAFGDDPRLPLPSNTALCDEKSANELGPALAPAVGHRLMREQLERALNGRNHPSKEAVK